MCSGVKIECRWIVPWGGGWEIEGNVLLFDILRRRGPAPPASPSPAPSVGRPPAYVPRAGQEGGPPPPSVPPPAPAAPRGVLPPTRPPHGSLPVRFWFCFFFPFGYASQLILSAVSSQMSFLRSGL